MDNGAPQMALLAAATASPQQMEGALRTVTFNRNPPVEGAMQTGIGISFFRHVAQASGFVFDALDSDRDGMITREEYNAGFDTLDMNKNGKLSREEINFDLYFSALDKDGDGQLSREEYEAGFGMIDTDNDGKICRSEFLAAAGPYTIVAMSPAGTASQSGLIHVGDLLVEVNEVSVLGLTVAQSTALIMGEPSSPITLTISTPAPLAAATDQAQIQSSLQSQSIIMDNGAPQLALLAAATDQAQAQAGAEAAVAVAGIQVEGQQVKATAPPQQVELLAAATDQEGAETAVAVSGIQVEGQHVEATAPPQQVELLAAATDQEGAEAAVAVSGIQVEGQHVEATAAPPQQVELLAAATDQAQAQEGAEAAVAVSEIQVEEQQVKEQQVEGQAQAQEGA
jgi:Ca2+-binding EF-hand superfamily protein